MENMHTAVQLWFCPSLHCHLSTGWRETGAALLGNRCSCCSCLTEARTTFTLCLLTLCLRHPRKRWAAGWQGLVHACALLACMLTAQPVLVAIQPLNQPLSALESSWMCVVSVLRRSTLQEPICQDA